MSRRPRTVLTTGSSSGLGLATVIELARRGHDSVGSVRSSAKADVVAAAAEAAGVAVRTVLLDVDDAKGCAAVVEELRPEVLVNNAGVMRYAAVEEVTDEEARRLFETLVLAPTRLARLCIPVMRERGFGRIIQISSISARASFPLMGWYQGCKQALEGISDALRLEVASAGIAVSLIEPGLFESGMSHELEASAAPESPYAKAYARSAQIYGRLGVLMTDAPTVARVIADAIESRSPSARYPVGMDAQFNVLSDPVTPTALRDRAIRSFFGL
ncbi:MAG: SDR family NAD(P)-dependent oxidoreductase [Deltaproteobacteria bacterium]|nr:SDR family NAD(P)-dependent oxidoreductase [Deltaproteobacteria bacterium]